MSTHRHGSLCLYLYYRRGGQTAEYAAIYSFSPQRVATGADVRRAIVYRMPMIAAGQILGGPYATPGDLIAAGELVLAAETS